MVEVEVWQEAIDSRLGRRKGGEARIELQETQGKVSRRQDEGGKRKAGDENNGDGHQHKIGGGRRLEV